MYFINVLYMVTFTTEILFLHGYSTNDLKTLRDNGITDQFSTIKVDHSLIKDKCVLFADLIKVY